MMMGAVWIRKRSGTGSRAQNRDRELTKQQRNLKSDEKKGGKRVFQVVVLREGTVLEAAETGGRTRPLKNRFKDQINERTGREMRNEMNQSRENGRWDKTKGKRQKKTHNNPTY